MTNGYHSENAANCTRCNGIRMTQINNMNSTLYCSSCGNVIKTKYNSYHEFNPNVIKPFVNDLEIDFNHFLSYTGFINESQDVIEKLKIAYTNGNKNKEL